MRCTRCFKRRSASVSYCVGTWGQRMAISVMIVEDEPDILQRFAGAVVADSALHLFGAVSNGKDAVAMLDAECPDVVLIDLGLPDMSGIEVIRHAAKCCPQCDVLVVTMFADDEHMLASIKAGATGYLLKDAVNARITSSILEIHNGGSPISPSIARRVLMSLRVDPIAAKANAGLSRGEASPLSEREVEILRLVAKGFSFETVGEVLCISRHTVVTHVKRVYRKLAVHSRGEAVYEAVQLGLL